MRSPSIVLVTVALAAAATLVPVASAGAEPVPVPTPSAPPSGTLLPPPSLTDPPPSIPSTTAVWVNGTLRVVYSSAGPFYNGSSDWDAELFIDGKRVDSGYTQPGPFKDRVVTVRRAASAGPALVELKSVAYVERGSFDDVYPTTYFSAVVRRQEVDARRGQVSAATLLGRLAVAKEHHAESFRRSRFGGWRDADHDGETTPAEVLRAESTTRVTTRRHLIESGRWISPYDGTTTRRASRLTVDHLVPLQEAWTSGAATWSAKKRLAYRNDLAFAPSLAAVPRTTAAARGGREPNRYLPTAAGYRCAYVRNWIAVKYRWGLTVDRTEKAALATDLAKYCVSPYMTAPRRRDVAALIG